MADAPTPSRRWREPVIRHRGGGRDENGQLIPAGPPTTLLAMAVAPGAASEHLERGRDGKTIEHTVYLPLGTDLVSSDELTVRGERFRIIVKAWELRGRGGLEVLCMRGQG